LPLKNVFIQEGLKRAAIDEFLEKELKRAGYAGVELFKTPIRTRVVIYAARPGLIIGRGGHNIRELTQILEERFGIENPQIEVEEVEDPDLSAKVVAARIAAALQRGVHFRRAAYFALRRIMEAGARGAEIIIRGKLVSQRAKYRKFTAGYIAKTGEPAEKFVDEAVTHVLLKPGVMGIHVKIMRPDAELPDHIKIKEKEIEIKEEEGVEEES